MKMRMFATGYGAVPIALAVAMVGCGDESSTAPDSDRGAVEVTASTMNNLDPDGFQVSLDGEDVGTVPVNGSLILEDVPSGSRTLGLEGIAPNCEADGGGTTTVSVDGGETARVSFTVQCTDPPDGRIYFRRGGPGGSHVSVVNADGTGRMDLAPHGGSGDGRFVFSPEGDRVAFTDWGGDRLRLVIMARDGSNRSPVTSDGHAYEGNPAWSPDGTRITYQMGWDPMGIAAMAPDGTDVRVLREEDEAWVHEPDWSPDGSRIAFSRSTAYASWESDDRVWVMDADGTNAAPLTDPSPLCEDPDWGTGWPLWHDSRPQWSPDGTRLLFLRGTECDPDPDNDYVALYVMNADGSDPTELVRDVRTAVWSPDGTRIAFIKEHVYVMSVDGTGQTMILESRGWELTEEYAALGWGR